MWCASRWRGHGRLVCSNNWLEHAGHWPEPPHEGHNAKVSLLRICGGGVLGGLVSEFYFPRPAQSFASLRQTRRGFVIKIHRFTCSDAGEPRLLIRVRFPVRHSHWPQLLWLKENKRILTFYCWYRDMLCCCCGRTVATQHTDNLVSMLIHFSMKHT